MSMFVGRMRPIGPLDNAEASGSMKGKGLGQESVVVFRAGCLRDKGNILIPFLYHTPLIYKILAEDRLVIFCVPVPCLVQSYSKWDFRFPASMLS